jgi:hemerythrin-like domain-containing protein
VLFNDPAPDFSDPIGLLAACHGRIRAFCDLLERLPDWLDRHGPDDEAIASIGRVQRYFDSGAVHHHADEEQDLFPLLQGHPDAAALITRLQADHQELEARWETLSDELRALVAGETPSGGRLEERIGAFCAAYRRHIALEDERLLPLAREQLNAAQRRSLGRRMAQRRAADPAGTQ